MFNPMQGRIESLMQQRQMIEQQLQALNQYQMPNISINNMQPTQQPMPVNFDFNGKWVGNENEAKGVANNNLPLILFDKNNPIFYMKNLDGSFKKFKFEEIIEQPNQDNNNRLDALELKLSAILESLSNGGTITPPKQEKPVEVAKTSSKGGKTNG